MTPTTSTSAPSSPTSTPTTTTAPASSTIPTIALTTTWSDYEFGPGHDRVLWGLSVGGNQSTREQVYDAYEQRSGRPVSIGHTFHPWDDPIPSEVDLYHLANDRLLLLSWNGTDTIEIASGIHDDWIRTQARAVGDLNDRILLRWLWEMDGRRRLETVHSGPDYINAWNHVRAIFDEEGVDNAEFVWCPNDFLFDTGLDPLVWYPGDDHVDWLCADGYNWSESPELDTWESFEEIFRGFYDWAEPRGLPIMIAETGSGEDGNGAKAAWISELPHVLETEFPAIDAVVYFDIDATARGHLDWRLSTSVPTLDAWVGALQHPYTYPQN